MNFREPICDWSCNRINKTWCNEHIRYMDFLVYLETKKTIINHYRQIISHEESKKFHQGSVSSIDQMIKDSEKFIEKLKIQIKDFQNKYRE